MKAFSKLLKNQAGFSLTEVIVGGGILAGVGLAGAVMFKNQKMAQKRVDYDLILNNYHQNLVKILSVPANCNATLGSSLTNDPNLYGNGIPAGTELNSFQRCAGFSGSPGTPCTDLKRDAGSILGTRFISTTTSKGYPGFPSDYIDKTEVWRIQKIAFASAVTQTGYARLQVTYDLNPRLQKSLGDREIKKDILLNLRLFNNKFKECFNSQESSMNNLQNDICETMTSGISSTGSIMRWDDETQSCVANMVNKTCTGGNVIVGIGSDGIVRCRPADQYGIQVDPSHNDTSTPATACTAGKKPQVYMDGDYLRVLCN